MNTFLFTDLQKEDNVYIFTIRNNAPITIYFR